MSQTFPTLSTAHRYAIDGASRAIGLAQVKFNHAIFARNIDDARSAVAEMIEATQFLASELDA